MERVYYTWDQWEDYPAGFYDNKPRDPMSDEQCRDAYRDFLRDTPRFQAAMDGVLRDWPNSTEHNLTNERMNRLAWLGQAAACYDLGLPSIYRGGFMRLSLEEKRVANLAALGHLNTWLADHGEPALTLETAQSKTEMDLY